MKKLALILFVIVVSACGDNNSRSNVEAPGDEKSAKTKALELGADVLQGKSPLRKINAYLNGFHFYNGDIKSQMEAHHYVSQLNEDVHQAIIYDGNDETAKIMGIEYIISERLFRQLPEEEKLLWHSHHYEVASGTLVAPGIPEIAEHELMEKLISTYGKTIHTWHTDLEKTLPLGVPQIMMGATRDGLLDTSMINDRDRRFGISSAQKKENRADIPVPKVLPGANAWENGIIRQLTVTNEPVPHMHHR